MAVRIPKSLWKNIPVLCLVPLIYFNAFERKFGEESSMILNLILLVVSITSVFIWMKQENAGGKFRKEHRIMLVSIAVASLFFAVLRCTHFFI